MDARIQKLIVDYFSFFEEFHNTAKTCLKECQNLAVSINKLIARCRKINEAQLTGSPLEEFAGLQAKIGASLHNLISEEIELIRGNLSKLDDLLAKLCNKHRLFTESCLQIDFTEPTPLIKGTPYQPPLKQLQEFAQDTLTFASEIVAQIDTSVNVIAQKQLNTDSLVCNFKILVHWQQRIPEILAYMSFCSENEI